MNGLLFVVYVAYRFLSIDKECRILQLNHYQLVRSIHHVKQTFHFTQRKGWHLLIHLPFVLLCFSEQAENLFTLLLIVYFYLGYKTKIVMHQQVHLVYTKRILRLYISLTLLYALLFFLCRQTSLFIWLILLLMTCNPLMVLCAACINAPFEKIIRNYYVSLAKQIMKQHSQLIKIGIVGSYGKTSTKNILHACLSQRYYCLKSQRSYNNLMGNTLMIRNELKRVHEVMIAEMGSDHVGEIKRLLHFIKPGYVILTSIGNQHMETFKTQANIVREKTSPLHYLKRSDFAFINLDDAYLYAHKDMGVCQKVYYGKHEQAHYSLCDVVLNEWGSSFNIVYRNEKIAFKTSLLGYYNIMNIVASIALAHTLHVRFENLQKAIAALQPVPHRLQSIAKSHYTLIDNAYNSNVHSFKNSLEVLSRIQKYRILITPGLIDLKEDDKINNKLMDYVFGNVEEVIIVGYKNRAALCAGLKRNHFTCYQIVDTMEEAFAYIEALEKDDFVALIENDIDKDYMNQRY
ncbi:MAG: UDP-N-acetylmuramoyl-tripeptide--D-alanyl-D-alanine ligase [Erysipelotrichia bacterium]|nr:UDP-N-acetylmuramoyl-tripeptide--D-alanyl-D-alanine ligase [Erysipelotrichia bacterium]NCC53928.1 UDP-N-acetylmuramoyl-tripeptide--D-alanyl-D-alanine ligase [Erysipelotrichia bacterium]